MTFYPSVFSQQITLSPNFETYIAGGSHMSVSHGGSISASSLNLECIFVYANYPRTLYQ